MVSDEPALIHEDEIGSMGMGLPKPDEEAK